MRFKDPSQDSGCWGLGVRVWCFGFFGFRVEGLGFRVQGPVVRKSIFEKPTQSSACWILPVVWVRAYII